MEYRDKLWGIKQRKCNGRNSNEIIKKRRDIIESIFKEYNYTISKSAFESELFPRLKEADIPKPSPTTLQRDRNALEKDSSRSFSFSKKNITFTPHAKATTMELITEITHNNIRQYRIESCFASFVLNDTEFYSFSEKWNNLLTTYDEDNEKCDDDILYVFLIFKITGLSEYICSTFKELFPEILFTTSHDYCSEFAIEIKDFLKVTEPLKALFN